MRSERTKIRKLFERLRSQPMQKFPAKGQKLNAPKQHGVYLIKKGKVVLHVGRTTRARNGLHQRLNSHLHGRSSFTKAFLDSDGSQLRDGYSYQALIVTDPRLRALLEAYAAGCLCPKHMGTAE